MYLILIQWNLQIKDTLNREVSFIRRLNCTNIVGIGRVDLYFIERFSLFGVFFIGGSTIPHCMIESAKVKKSTDLVLGTVQDLQYITVFEEYISQQIRISLA